MQDKVFAALRIRNRETAMLDAGKIDQLVSSASLASALSLLAEWGWGDGEPTNAETMLKAEQKKTWDLAYELVDNKEFLSVLCITKDYHNLKAAIKSFYTESKLPPERIFEEGGWIDPRAMQRAIEAKEYGLFPDEMARAVKEAEAALAHSGDGQKCDQILDKAAMEALYAAGREAGEEVLKEYATVTVASANVRIALRGAAAGWSYATLVESMAPMEEMDVAALAKAALESREAVAEYLRMTPYAALADSLGRSMRTFETACDNLLIEHMKPQKYEYFTPGPVAAYVLARESEIKCVRIILTGKANHLPVHVIRESLRQPYV